MNKKRVNAFTLVEMLIVIVIIGILIAALMPRMQSAQGRARDVARKNDLAQIQTAIVTSQQDKGNWPGMKDTQKEGSTNFTTDEAVDGMGVSEIKDALITAGMSSVPKDPLESTEVKGLGNDTNNFTGDYGYMVTYSNGTQNGGFVLMAKTEIEGGSNRVVCDTTLGAVETNMDGKISKDTDLKDIIPCTKLSKITNATDKCKVQSGQCSYHGDGELRYILKY